MEENILSNNHPQARILIVDDHPGMATTLGRAIAQLSPEIEVITAVGGKDALEQVKDLPVDLLITDMMMPGMNGMELIENLNSHPAGRPSFTILMTAYDIPGLKESARRLKVNEMIIKPFPPERMRTIVQNALEEMSQSHSNYPEVVNSQSFSILIADDQADNFTLLSRYLKNEGFNLIRASTGSETLEKIRAEVPDLILLDINMPQKDGFEVLKEMRQDPAIEHIPVIILTATRLDPLDIRTGLNLGADDYMTKPFDRRELLARIRTKLRSRDSEEAIRRRTREFSILPEIGREFSARQNLDELAGIILRRSVETIGAGLGHIFLFSPGEDARHQEYHLSASTADVRVKPLPPLAAILDQIHDSAEGLIIPDAQEDPFWKDQADDSCRSILLIPLQGRLNLLGLLILFHEKPVYFNVDHRLLLRVVASQAAIAVEGFSLHQNSPC
jgi:CheY-like chemotaxis protein